MNKYIDHVLSSMAIHVQNVMEDNDDAQCVVLGNVYLLCDTLEEKDATIEAQAAAIENAEALEKINIDTIAGLEARIAELERVTQNLINEHCEKGGSEGFHYPAEQQGCWVMRGAMRVLSNNNEGAE